MIIPELFIYGTFIMYLVGFIISLLVIRILYKIPATFNHRNAQTQLLVEIARKIGVDEGLIKAFSNKL